MHGGKMIGVLRADKKPSIKKPNVKRKMAMRVGAAGLIGVLGGLGYLVYLEYACQTGDENILCDVKDKDKDNYNVLSEFQTVCMTQCLPSNLTNFPSYPKDWNTVANRKECKDNPDASKCPIYRNPKDFEKDSGQPYCNDNELEFTETKDCVDHCFLSCRGLIYEGDSKDSQELVHYADETVRHYKIRNRENEEYQDPNFQKNLAIYIAAGIGALILFYILFLRGGLNSVRRQSVLYTLDTEACIRRSLVVCTQNGMNAHSEVS